MLDPHPGETVVDAACGNGWYSLWLALKGCRTLGFDVRSESIRSASAVRDRLALDRAAFIQADMRAIPLPNATFDKALCVTSIEHVVEDRLALAELRRILKNRGKLVLTTPLVGRSFLFRSFVPGELDQARDGYRPNDISEKLTRAGFKVLTQDYVFRLFGQTAWELGQLLRNQRVTFRLMRTILFRLALMDGASPKSRFKNEIVLSAESVSDLALPN